jgi:bifunctional non-homologous end joining protein LigD
MGGFLQRSSINKRSDRQVKKMRPMLAKIGDKSILNETGYIYEPKLDGFRAILHMGKEHKFISRTGKDLTQKFSDIKLPRINANSCIIDGEIVAYNKKGIPDFNLLTNGAPAVFVAFDILEKDGVDLRAKPLTERKKILHSTLKENNTVQVMYYTTEGQKLWSVLKKKGAEGVIAKKKDAMYQDGVRSNSWLKIKFTNTIDAIVIGFTHSKRKISSLALGLYEDDNIVFIGKVGTGFDESFIGDFLPKLLKIKTTKKIDLLPYDVISVKPRYVVEVGYLEFTPDKKLRAPVFKRLRIDKDVSECTFP